MKVADGFRLSLMQREGCIVYSFGSNGETTFEQDILAKSKCATPVSSHCHSRNVPHLLAIIKGEQSC